MISISSQKQRAGTYTQQSHSYCAFIPKPLPPDPPIRVGSFLQTLLSQATHTLSQLNDVTLALSDSDSFAFMCVCKEAILSSQIKDSQSPLQNLLTEEAKLFDPITFSGTSEVINYVRAMNYGLKRLATLPVSVRLIKEIHAELMRGVRGGELRPGELRTRQNWIGPAGCTLTEATFVPPPPQEVPQALADLEKFLHTQDDMPALIRIGLADAQFATIHPFSDGNGRIGRLLIILLLTEQGLLQKPVLYLSHYFKRYCAEYYERLQRVHDLGDWEGWLEFFLRGIIEVSQDVSRAAVRFSRLSQEYRTVITEHLRRAYCCWTQSYSFWPEKRDNESYGK